MKKSFVFRVLSVILCIALAVGFTACGGNENIPETPVEEFAYSYDAETQGMRIDEYTGTSPKVHIPDEIDSESVTAIGNEAFRSTNIESIQLPQSLKVIGRSAFIGCETLTSIEIPDNVTTIGTSAFNGCRALTNVVIGNGVTEIAGTVFSHCSGLTSIEIPDSVTQIGYYAFGSCSGLTSVAIPDSVTTIGRNTFGDCPRLNDETKQKILEVPYRTLN